MKAHLIDPEQQTVTGIEYDGDWRVILELIQASVFTAIRFNGHNDVVYIDDEGLLKNDHRRYFVINGYQQPLKGRGLVVGTDGAGEARSPIVSIQDMRASITFMSEGVSVEPTMKVTSWEG